jgi:hypothetical protein
MLLESLAPQSDDSAGAKIAVPTAAIFGQQTQGRKNICSPRFVLIKITGTAATGTSKKLLPKWRGLPSGKTLISPVVHTKLYFLVYT